MRPLTSTLPRLLLLAGFTLTSLTCIPWHAAHAQSADEAEAEQDAMDAQKQAEARKEARRAAPPSALPGADTDASDNSHARVDVNPTAALFDAINRGSLMGAKEALNRGADINAKNVLEQTPLDLAIDLGRNDIMFQLLSLRTYNSDGQTNVSVTHTDITSTHGTGHITINGQASVVAPTPHFTPVEDTGHANPSVGFLGFAPPGTASETSQPPVNKKHSTYTRKPSQEN